MVFLVSIRFWNHSGMGWEKLSDTGSRPRRTPAPAWQRAARAAAVGLRLEQRARDVAHGFRSRLGLGRARLGRRHRRLDLLHHGRAGMSAAGTGAACARAAVHRAGRGAFDCAVALALMNSARHKVTRFGSGNMTVFLGNIGLLINRAQRTMGPLPSRSIMGPTGDTGGRACRWRPQGRGVRQQRRRILAAHLRKPGAGPARAPPRPAWPGPSPAAP